MSSPKRSVGRDSQAGTEDLRPQNGETGEVFREIELSLEYLYFRLMKMTRMSEMETEMEVVQNVSQNAKLLKFLLSSLPQTYKIKNKNGTILCKH